jgi:protein TonB
VGAAHCPSLVHAVVPGPESVEVPESEELEASALASPPEELEGVESAPPSLPEEPPPDEDPLDDDDAVESPPPSAPEEPPPDEDPLDDDVVASFPPLLPELEPEPEPDPPSPDSPLPRSELAPPHPIPIPAPSASTKPSPAATLKALMGFSGSRPDRPRPQSPTARRRKASSQYPYLCPVRHRLFASFGA